MISNELQAIKGLLFRQKAATPRGTSMPAEMIAQARAGADATFDAMPAEVVVAPSITIEPGVLGGIGGEWYRVADDPDKLAGKVLLYVHGGAYENGTVRSRRFIATHIADTAKVDTFSMDYTQWPEGRHPVALDEAVAAFHAIADQYGADNVFMGGESAGAMLTLAVCHWLRDHGEERPAKVLAIAPVIDMAVKFPSRSANEDIDPMFYDDIDEQVMAHYFEGQDPRDPYVSARYGSFEGFPATMVTVATDEVLYDDAVTLHELLDEAGVANVLSVCEGGFHAYQCVPCPEAYASFAELGAFLRG